MIQWHYVMITVENNGMFQVRAGQRELQELRVVSGHLGTRDPPVYPGQRDLEVQGATRDRQEEHFLDLLETQVCASKLLYTLYPRYTQ